MNVLDVQPVITRVARGVFLVALAGLIGCAVAATFDPAAMARSYLPVFVLVWTLSLGSLGLAMLHPLTRGGWGVPIRPLLHAGALTMPLVGLLFVPIALTLPILYPWADTSRVAADHVLLHKRPYLNEPFFAGRAIGYFFAWTVLAVLTVRWSAAMAFQSDRAVPRRLRRLCAGGIVLLMLTGTFAAIDWIQSLEPEWYSTMFGGLITIGGVLSALALAIAGGTRFAAPPFVSQKAAPQTLNDLGNLLLAFVVIWTYLAFSQFFIIWSGDQPYLATWYFRRLAGGWEWLILAIALLHFALPMLLLLSRDVKQQPRLLAALAGWLVLMQALHVFWTVAPSLGREEIALNWSDAAALAGPGGLWLGVYLWQLNRRLSIEAAGWAAAVHEVPDDAVHDLPGRSRPESDEGPVHE